MDLHSGPSFKQRILSRLLASIKHFIQQRDLKRAETGFITLLRIYGSFTVDSLPVKTLEFSPFCTYLVATFILSQDKKSQ